MKIDVTFKNKEIVTLTNVTQEDFDSFYKKFRSRWGGDIFLWRGASGAIFFKKSEVIFAVLVGEK